MKRCIQCKRLLYSNVFFYNDKNHATCFSCSKKRINKKNICQICGIRARYNYSGETLGIACKKHSKPDMVDIKSPKCIVCNKIRPTYNLSIETKATHCSGCALPDMVDIKHPKCIVCKKTQPTYNLSGETKATHCSGCALPDMVDIKHPKCIVCKKIRPTYNLSGETKATHCRGCALPDMVNIKDRKCIVCKKTIPTYNLSGETKATHCRGCALPDMVDIKNPKCIVCKKIRPTYNLSGETKATHCSGCALPDMVDIKHPKCIVCKKRASYGIPCNKPTMCSLHKEEGMINKPNSYCRKKDCKNKAVYGIKMPIHCESHKVDNDINLVERKCTKCGNIDVLIDGLCVNICVNVNINNIYKKNQKVKEKRVYKILCTEIGEPSEYNKRVSYDCGGSNSEEKEFVYDFGTHQVHIEVDENEHKSYCKLGEVNRMRNIFSNEGGVPIVFIRYNPDSFIDKDGKKNKLSQSKREELLIKWVKYYSETKPEYFLSVKYLFYDGHSDGRDKYYNIDIYKTFNEYCVCGEEFCIEGIYNDHIKECKKCLKLEKKIDDQNKIIESLKNTKDEKKSNEDEEEIDSDESDGE